jgi:hypothetical protein
MTTVGRKPKVPARRFKQEYDKSKSIDELSMRLGISRPTAYAYLKKFGMRPPTRRASVRECHNLFEEYRGLTTLKYLCEKNQMSMGGIRGRLIRAVEHHWRKRREYPRPLQLAHIKVYHLLVEDPGMFDDPEGIAEQTATALPIVDEYLRMIYSNRTQQS